MEEYRPPVDCRDKCRSADLHHGIQKELLQKEGSRGRKNRAEQKKEHELFKVLPEKDKYVIKEHQKVLYILTRLACSYFYDLVFCNVHFTSYSNTSDISRS